jgi:hypothetical protein
LAASRVVGAKEYDLGFWLDIFFHEQHCSRLWPLLGAINFLFWGENVYNSYYEPNLFHDIIRFIFYQLRIEISPELLAKDLSKF